jgi:hypothetical protein
VCGRGIKSTGGNPSFNSLLINLIDLLREKLNGKASIRTVPLAVGSKKENREENVSG